MKILKKISLLLFVSLCCANLHAGKDHYKYSVRHQDTYKTPPKRQYLNYQQRQVVRDLQEYRQEAVEAPVLQPKNKKLMVLLMLILPIIDAIFRYNSSEWAPISHGNRLPIYEIDFTDESRDWSCGRLQNDPNSYHCFVGHGEICEDLSEGSKYCSSIRRNYRVDSCIYNNGIPSYCVSFDPGGIIGDQSEATNIDVRAAYKKAKLECDARTDSFAMAEEAKTPKYLATVTYSNGSKTDFETFGTESYELRNISKYLPDGSTQSCFAVRSALHKTDFSMLFGVIDGFAQKYNFPQDQEWIRDILVTNDRICAPIFHNIELPYIHMATCNRGDMSISGVHLQLSDNKLKAIFGHELYHRKQHWRWCKVPGFQQLSSGEALDEVEADLASLLATSKPCLVCWLMDIDGLNESDLSTNQITRGDMIEALKERSTFDPEHSKVIHRAAFLVIMNEHNRMARVLLLGPVADGVEE